MRRSTFLVWAPPHRGSRSAWLARELGISDIRYIAGSERRGVAGILFKYPHQFMRTWMHLMNRRPLIVFVQSPPSFAAWTATLYCAMAGAGLIIDAHSDAFQRGIWTRPRWLNRLVARRAVATLATDQHWISGLRAWGATAVRVPDVPTSLPVGDAAVLTAGFNVAVVNTWAPDEPLGEVISAARQLPEVTFHVTGHDGPATTLGVPVPPNVRFTGFLPVRAYYGLLASVHAVMCLTTRDHTMQRGACETLSLGVPVITSDWPILREYFCRGTVHVTSTSSSIRDGVQMLMARHDSYKLEIVELRSTRRREWTQRRAVLRGLVADALDRGGPSRQARGPRT